MSDAVQCSNCQNELGPGSAGGLCARCYQYRRRNGRLPPSELQVTGDLSEHLHLRLDKPLMRNVERAAKREKVDVSGWVRRALKRMFDGARENA